MDVEQTQTVEATPIADDGWQEATDAELIAAAQEAGGAEAAAEADGIAPVKPPAAKVAPATAAEPVVDPDEPKIAAVLRAREKAFAERQSADDYAAQRRAQADEAYAATVAKARQQATADYEAELSARRAKFRETPTAAIRELGFTTDELVDGVTREGTPEWKAMRALQQELATTKAEAGTAKKVAADFEAYKAEQEKAVYASRVAQVRDQFLTAHASPEKAPYLHKRYDADEIFEKSDALARKWQAAGVPFDHADVAQYLEAESRKRLTGVASVPPQQVSGMSGAQKVRAAIGSRTLSSANGSERRASPKPIEEMAPDEERAALIEAAAEARRANGG